jgi:hypothetical protein
MKKLFLLICLCPVLIFSQVPGYMGRKTVVGYGVHVSPVVFSAVSGAGENSMNVMHDIFIERATNKNLSLGFSLKLYKTAFDNSVPVEIPGSQYHYREYTPSGYYSISARNYNFYGKLFYSRYLAPWGKYFMFGLNFMRYTAVYNPQYMQVSVTEGNYGSYTTKFYSNFGPREQSYKAFDVMLGFGKSRVFADRIIVDFGYTINLASAIAPLFMTVSDEYFYGGIPMENYIEETSKLRVQGVNRFNVFLKLGYLF